MKKLLLFGSLTLATVTLVLCLSAFQSEKKFYYAFSEKIPLSVVRNKTIIRYANAANRTEVTAAMRTATKDILAEWQDDRTVIVTTNSVDARTQTLQKAATQGEVVTSNPMYAIATGLEMGVTDEILVKFLDKVSKNQMDSLHRQFKVKVAKTTEIYQLLKVSRGADALQIANQYQESGLVKFSHPNFITKVETFQVIPNDQFFNRQFYLNNTSQVIADGHTGTTDADLDAPEAWVTTQGNNNIVVAVIDQGVTSDHPDLPNARQVRLSGSNFADGNPNDPSATGNNNHGNSCAGVIAATQGNGQGITGIAPNCRIMPIRVFDNNADGITPQALADAITFARNNGAQVISNSWGFTSDNPNFQPVIVSAIQAAVNSGRGGLGCVVVFAASNSARHTQGDNGQVRFPANVNIAGVITVGASDRNDIQADYSPSSNPGSGNNQIIDVVAPSHRAYPPSVYAAQGITGGIEGETFEAWSLDIPLNTGYNPWPTRPNQVVPPTIGEQLPNAGVNFQAYTGRFGGTTAACPQVAAVAALLLSINPNLTQQQIFNIITNTADKVGGYTYTNGISNELGNGRVNACSAVRQALGTLAINGPSSACQSGTSFGISASVGTNMAITWNTSANLTRTSAQGANPLVVRSNSVGYAWIDATLITPCGNIVLPRKTVFSGAPSYPGNIQGPTDICPNSGGYFTITPVSGALYYSWTWYGLQYYSGSGGSSYVTLSTPYNWNGGAVQVTAGNECGTSLTSTKALGRSYSCPGFAAYSVSPNPSTDQITIQSVTDKEAPLEVQAPKKSSKPVIEARLYYASDVHLVKSYQIDKDDFVIDTRKLKRGKYILHIIENGKIVVVDQLIFE